MTIREALEARLRDLDELIAYTRTASPRTMPDGVRIEQQLVLMEERDQIVGALQRAQEGVG